MTVYANCLRNVTSDVPVSSTIRYHSTTTEMFRVTIPNSDLYTSQTIERKFNLYNQMEVIDHTKSYRDEKSNYTVTSVAF